MYAHVNLWTMTEAGSTSDSTTAQEYAARLREKPGFISYALIRTAEHEVAAVTLFDTREQLEAALQQMSGFVQERVRPLAAGEPERREGEVLYHTTAQLPAGGR